MLGLVFFALITAIASALHGGNHASKGFIMAGHIAWSTLASPFAVIAAPLFWLCFRRGDQARAELDYMSGAGNLSAVRRAYPLGFGYLIAPFIRFATKNPILDLPTRRRQELVGGFVIGLILYIPVILLEAFL